jgi:hypothetical protein
MTTPQLPSNTPVEHTSTPAADGSSTTLKLFSGPQQITVEWNIVLAEEDTRKFAGGYLLVADREHDEYQNINLGLGEVDEKLYVVTSLTNGHRYTVQYNQLMNDGSQISTLVGIISPCATPVPLVIKGDASATDVSTGSDGTLFDLNVIVEKNENDMYSSIDSTLIFKLFQVLEDAESTPVKTVDETNDIISRTFSGSAVQYGMNKSYVLEDIPVGHYKMQVIYSNKYGPSTSNLVDVYARLSPNNFTLTAYSGEDAKVVVDFEVNHNSNAPIETIEWSIHSWNGSSWSAVSSTPTVSNVSGATLSNGKFSNPSGSKLTGKATFTSLTNKSAHRIGAKGVTSAALDNRKSPGSGYDYAVPSFHGTDSISFVAPTSGTVYSYLISHGSSSGDFEHRYDISATQDGVTVNDTSLNIEKTTANSANILASLTLDGLKVKAKVWDVLTTELESYWLRDSAGNAPTEFSKDGSNYKLVNRGSVETAALSLVLTPDAVTELRVYERKKPKFSFNHKWNTNTVASTFKVTYGSGANDYITVTNSQARGVTSHTFVADLENLLTAGENYTIKVEATNSAGTSSATTLTVKYLASDPPALSSASGSQTGFTKAAMLYGAEPTSHDGWKDWKVVAKIKVNDVDKGEVEVPSTGYSIPNLNFLDVVKAELYFKAWYAGYDDRATHPNSSIAMEYSSPINISFTMNKLTDNFTDLAATQVVSGQDKTDSVTISWSHDEFPANATVVYKYLITKESVAGSSVTLGSSDVTTSTVNGVTTRSFTLTQQQYNKSHSIAMSSTVSYSDDTSDATKSATYNLSVTPLSATYTYTKIAGDSTVEPGIGLKDLQLAFQLSGSSGYYTKTKLEYKVNQNTSVETTTNYKIAVTPGMVEYRYDATLTATHSNAPWGNVTETFTFSSPLELLYSDIPTIIVEANDELKSITSQQGKQRFQFTLNARGDDVTSIYLMLVPSDSAPETILFKIPVDQTSKGENGVVYTYYVDYNVAPIGKTVQIDNQQIKSTDARYSDVTYLVLASNSLGMGIAENKLC